VIYKPSLTNRHTSRYCRLVAKSHITGMTTVLSSQTFPKLHTHTHTHPFNGPLSGTTRVSRYQKGKTNLDFTGARDSEWQWHQLGICKTAPRSRQITTPTPHRSVFYRPDALPATQPTASKHWRHFSQTSDLENFAIAYRSPKHVINSAEKGGRSERDKLDRRWSTKLTIPPSCDAWPLVYLETLWCSLLTKQK